MNAEDRNAVKAMIRALDRFSVAQSEMTDHGWVDLNDALFGADIPTWNEVGDLRKCLMAVASGKRVTPEEIIDLSCVAFNSPHGIHELEGG